MASKSIELSPVAPSLQEAPEGYAEHHPSYIEREPVRVSTGISALVAAISVLVFKMTGVEIDAEAQLAIVTAIAIVGPIVAGWWARRRVTPVK